jgi:putative membrane protein insertion efficiency factor
VNNDRPSVPSVPALLLILPIEGYRRVVSPFLGQRCRFAPSCSAYAVDAIRMHGTIRGLWLAACRIARCHPWNPGGVDPVPPVRSLGPGPARDVSDLFAAKAASPSSSVMTPGATRCPTS